MSPIDPEGPLPYDTTRLSTGIEGLDEILHGGLPAGQVHLVQGGSGVGKTTFGMQFLLAGAARGERTLLFSLSERKGELEHAARSHGWDLDAITVRTQKSRMKLGEADEQSVFGPAHVELSEWMQQIRQAVESVSPDRLVLDSVTTLRLMAGSPILYRRQILALKSYLAELGTTLVLLDQSPEEGQDVYLYSLAHGIIDLEHRAPPMGPVRHRVRVRKMRGMSYASGFHDYAIVPGGLRVFPQLPRSATAGGRGDQGQISTGIDELDELLCGGLDRGACIAIVGPSGVGKSTVATQCALAAAHRGERALLYSFEESEPSLVDRTQGLDLDAEPVLEDGMLRIGVQDPTGLNPDAFNHQVRLAVEQEDVRMVVIDSVAALLGGVPDERHLGILLLNLINYLKSAQVTSLLMVPQHGFPGSDAASTSSAFCSSDTRRTRERTGSGRSAWR